MRENILDWTLSEIETKDLSKENILEEGHQRTAYAPVWGDVHTAHPWEMRMKLTSVMKMQMLKLCDPLKKGCSFVNLIKRV